MSKKRGNNSKISCDVTSCDYNDSEEGECTLNNVCISCQCSKDECHNTSSTVCESFVNSGGNITDNVYEVTSEMEKEEA